ncbi:MAG: hypothetical protein J3K34DRAFT_213262 [Monoraphidium minutum]|nr:MAG: hypothetical protein J3K34DRAFT_213262 [Monoraphidium minutum]
MARRSCFTLALIAALAAALAPSASAQYIGCVPCSSCTNSYCWQICQPSCGYVPIRPSNVIVNVRQHRAWQLPAVGERQQPLRRRGRVRHRQLRRRDLPRVLCPGRVLGLLQLCADRHRRDPRLQLVGAAALRAHPAVLPRWRHHRLRRPFHRLRRPLHRRRRALGPRRRRALERRRRRRRRRRQAPPAQRRSPHAARPVMGCPFGPLLPAAHPNVTCAQLPGTAAAASFLEALWMCFSRTASCRRALPKPAGPQCLCPSFAITPLAGLNHGCGADTLLRSRKRRRPPSAPRAATTHHAPRYWPALALSRRH